MPERYEVQPDFIPLQRPREWLSQRGHGPRNGAICGMGPRAYCNVLQIATVLAIFVVFVFGAGVRIGEAGNPGPGPGALDDSQASILSDTGSAYGTIGPWDEDLLDPASCISTLFAASKKFSGARHGMVFKLGDQGLGYYKDLPPTI